MIPGSCKYEFIGQVADEKGGIKRAVVAENDSVQIEKLAFGPFGTNTYVLICKDTGDSVVIDAAGEAYQILQRLVALLYASVLV